MVTAAQVVWTAADCFGAEEYQLVLPGRLAVHQKLLLGLRVPQAQSLTQLTPFLHEPVEPAAV